MIEQSFMIRKGAIIGCGFFGQIQLEAWRRIPGVEIVAACDADIEKARAFATRAYSCPQEMLDVEELDFVDIATGPLSHFPLAQMAALRKIAVICQKPMATTWGEAVGMVREAERAGTRLMIHENWRWQPWYREAQRLIAAGKIGTPVAYLLRTRAADGGGDSPYRRQPYFSGMPRLLVYETMVHHIDTARFLFGEIATVYAEGRRINPRINGEDQALLILVHDSALRGVIDGHRFTEHVPDSPPMGDALFEGDEGFLTISGSGDVYLGSEKVWTNTVTTGYRGDSVLATQRHFIECLETGHPFESEGREYLKTFAAVEACYRSMEAKRAVAVSDILKLQ